MFRAASILAIIVNRTDTIQAYQNARRHLCASADLPRSAWPSRPRPADPGYQVITIWDSQAKTEGDRHEPPVTCRPQAGPIPRQARAQTETTLMTVSNATVAEPATAPGGSAAGDCPPSAPVGMRPRRIQHLGMAPAGRRPGLGDDPSRPRLAAYGESCPRTDTTHCLISRY